MRKLLSYFLMTLGLACYLFVVYGFIERSQPKRVSFAYANEISVSPSPKQYDQPTVLDIPSLSIHLSIFPAKISHGEWEATTEGISYLIHSPTPGEVGNSILYGHNWPSLLGGLSAIKPGDTIIITSQHGKKAFFEVEYTSTVTPDDVSVLYQTKDRRITLYTCTGFLDSHRFVVVGILKE